MHQADVHDPDVVDVLRACVDSGVIPGTLTQIAVFAGFGPRLTRVFRTEDAAVLGFDDCPNSLRIHRRHGDADDADGPLRQSLGARDLFPGIAAVGAFPQTGAGSAAFEAVRRAFDAPRARIDDARIVRIEDQIDRADFIVDEEHVFPGRAAVVAAKNAALLARAVEMAEGCDVDEVGVLRMDADARDRARIFKTDVFPSLASVGGLPHAVAMRDVAANRLFAAADI